MAYTPAWWDTTYPFRRFLTIDPEGETLPDEHVVTVTYSYDETIAAGVMKSDFSDVEVVFVDYDQATPTSNVIAREVVATTTEVSISFLLQESVSEISEDEYFIYSGAETPYGSRPTYTANTYPITAIPTVANTRLSYTRPGEHWEAGVSNTQNAVATFVFNGPVFQLRLKRNLQGGIVKLYFDDDAAVTVDTYNTISETFVAFTKADLSNEDHTLRIEVTGTKSPMSTGTRVEIVDFKYARHVNVEEVLEQVYSPTSAFTYFSGT